MLSFIFLKYDTLRTPSCVDVSIWKEVYSRATEMAENYFSSVM
jgi:hypothetical protein